MEYGILQEYTSTQFLVKVPFIQYKNEFVRGKATQRGVRDSGADRSQTAYLIIDCGIYWGIINAAVP